MRNHHSRETLRSQKAIVSNPKMSSKVMFVFLRIAILACLRPIYCHPAVHMSAIPDPQCCDSWKAHSISCIMDVELSSIESVTSLTVYASHGDVNMDEFERVAAIELGRPAPLLFDASEQYNVSWNIGTRNNSISILVFSWKSPMVREVKRYKCEVKGVGTSGRELTISTSSKFTADTGNENTTNENKGMVVNFTSESGDSNIEHSDDFVVGPVKCRPHMINRDHLEAVTETILHGVANSTLELGEALQLKVNMLEEVAEAQRSDIADLQEKVSSLIDLYKITYLLSNFDILGIHKGNRFYVSKTDANFNIWAANSQCSQLDGHLVEIDDRDEYDFLVEHLEKIDGERFFTGGNDIHKEGVWRFWHSNRPLRFSNWLKGTPDNNNNNQHCLELLPLHGLQFNDVPCFKKGKFICEGPM
ncbi:C-type lectin [Elysia marginata]|uniref:C-type lectin n=1 Tax=Elysia marginata TaxID=1093978 RepID=A0AAV4F522_9GAST|nr:C-type lectin [Elysia marginata]